MKLQHKIVALSALAGILLWFAHSALHYHLSSGAGTFAGHLFEHAWLHLVIFVVFLGAGCVLSWSATTLQGERETTYRLNQTLRAIRHVNQLIVRETDEGKLIQDICERLVNEAGFNSSWVILRDAVGGLVREGHAGQGEDFEDLRGRIETGYVPPCEERALASGGTVTTPCSSRYCGDCPLAREDGHRGALTIPLTHDSEVIGIMSVSLATCASACLEEKKIFDEVAGDLAFALHGIRLESERIRSEELRRIPYEIADAVHTAPDLTALLRTIHERLGAFLNTENFFIALYDKKTDSISLPYFVDEKDQDTFDSFPVGKTMSAYVIKNDTPLLLPRDKADEWVRQGVIEMIGTPAEVWLGVPLRVDEEVIGVIVVQSYTDPNEFGEKHLEMLTFVSGQIGLSIERKRAQEDLRAQRENLQTILDSVPAYIFYKDLDGRYLKVNRALIEASGIPESGWIGRTVCEIQPRDAERHSDDDRCVIESGQPKHGIAEVFDWPDGRRTGLTDKIPYFDDEGNVAGVIGLSVDTTRRTEAEDALKQKEEELRQSQKMEAVGQLAGGIAHDFNNLLTAISGYTELMLARVGTEDQMHGDLSAIKKAAAQAASLTRQLLAFSRRQALQLSVVSINDLVSSTRDILRRIIGEDIELVTELSPSLKKVSVDPSMVEQVVMNLVVNARDAMPDGGSITVRTENTVVEDDLSGFSRGARAGEFVCISVQDTGCGMDKDTLEHVFEPFFTTKGPGSGTGLGLAVVYGNVKQNNGWVHVYSEPGLGTTFRIYLPVCEEAENDAVAKKTHASAPAGEGERILLVEDEDVVREFAVRALRERGYSVHEARTAEEALDTFRRAGGDFNLIFSDVVLPGKSGVQLVDELLANTPEMPVLLSSGYADRKSQWPAIQDRGFKFLQKPYSMNDLLRTVRDILM